MNEINEKNEKCENVMKEKKREDVKEEQEFMRYIFT